MADFRVGFGRGIEVMGIWGKVVLCAVWVGVICGLLGGVGEVSGAVRIQFDYRFDTVGFFDDAERRSVLQAAGDEVTRRLNDNLSEIDSRLINQMTAIIFDLSDPFNEEANSLTVGSFDVPADTVIIFAGGFTDGVNGTLAVASAGQSSVFGFGDFPDIVERRGQAGETVGDNATDFGPWGGGVSFDTEDDFFFGDLDSTVPVGKVDFLSVAMHEILHVLGIGSADSWDNKIVEVNGKFNFQGEASLAEYDGVLQDGGIPLEERDDGQLPGHFAQSVREDGQELLMAPAITLGRRKLMTELDYAALVDVGWEVEPLPVLVMGDADGDGDVDLDDYELWLVGVGMLSGAEVGDGDFDGDGDVDGFDFGIWQEAYGRGLDALIVGNGEVSGVPEPGVGGLLLMGLMWWGRRGV